jgi:hypothetical protein
MIDQVRVIYHTVANENNEMISVQMNAERFLTNPS